MPKIPQLFCYTRTATRLQLIAHGECLQEAKKSFEVLPTFGSRSVNESLIPEYHTFNRSLCCEEQQLHNTWPL